MSVQEEQRRLAVEIFDEFLDNLIRCFFHQPVSGITNDYAFHVRRDEPALLNQVYDSRLAARPENRKLEFN